MKPFELLIILKHITNKTTFFFNHFVNTPLTAYSATHTYECGYLVFPPYYVEKLHEFRFVSYECTHIC